MAALGYSPDAFGRAGTPLALSEISIQFKAPLRSRDRFDVTVAVAKVGGARLVMTQRILLTQRDGAPTRQVREGHVQYIAWLGRRRDVLLMR